MIVYPRQTHNDSRGAPIFTKMTPEDIKVEVTRSRQARRANVLHANGSCPPPKFGAHCETAVITVPGSEPQRQRGVEIEAVGSKYIGPFAWRLSGEQ